MPLPTVAITDAIVDPSGDPLVGKRVSFRLLSPIRDGSGNVLVAALAVVGYTNASGVLKDGGNALTLVVPSTGEAAYEVSESWTAATYTTALTAADAPSISYQDLPRAATSTDDVSFLATAEALADEATARAAADAALEAAIGSGGSPTGGLVSKDLVFTESSDSAGTYTGTVVIPAGATVLGIASHTEVAWSASATFAGVTMIVSDNGGAIWGGAPDTGNPLWLNVQDVSGLDQCWMWTDFSDSDRGTLSSQDYFPYYPAGTTITAVITAADGASGSPSGVTRLKVSYFTSADESAATFEATP